MPGRTCGSAWGRSRSRWRTGRRRGRKLRFGGKGEQSVHRSLAGGDKLLQGADPVVCESLALHEWVREAGTTDVHNARKADLFAEGGPQCPALQAASCMSPRGRRGVLQAETNDQRVKSAQLAASKASANLAGPRRATRRPRIAVRTRKGVGVDTCGSKLCVLPCCCPSNVACSEQVARLRPRASQEARADNGSNLPHVLLGGHKAERRRAPVQRHSLHAPLKSGPKIGVRQDFGRDRLGHRLQGLLEGALDQKRSMVTHVPREAYLRGPQNQGAALPGQCLPLRSCQEDPVDVHEQSPAL